MKAFLINRPRTNPIAPAAGFTKDDVKDGIKKLSKSNLCDLMNLLCSIKQDKVYDPAVLELHAKIITIKNSDGTNSKYDDIAYNKCSDILKVKLCEDFNVIKDLSLSDPKVKNILKDQYYQSSSFFKGSCKYMNHYGLLLLSLLAGYHNKKTEGITDNDVHNYLDKLKKSGVLDNSYLIDSKDLKTLLEDSLLNGDDIFTFAVTQDKINEAKNPNLDKFQRVTYYDNADNFVTSKSFSTKDSNGKTVQHNRSFFDQIEELNRAANKSKQLTQKPKCILTLTVDAYRHGLQIKEIDGAKCLVVEVHHRRHAAGPVMELELYRDKLIIKRCNNVPDQIFIDMLSSTLGIPRAEAEKDYPSTDGTTIECALNNLNLKQLLSNMFGIKGVKDDNHAKGVLEHILDSDPAKNMVFSMVNPQESYEQAKGTVPELKPSDAFVKNLTYAHITDGNTSSTGTQKISEEEISKINAHFIRIISHVSPESSGVDVIFTMCFMGKARSGALGVVLLGLYGDQQAFSDFLDNSGIQPNIEICLLYAQVAISHGYKFPDWFFAGLKSHVSYENFITTGS